MKRAHLKPSDIISIDANAATTRRRKQSRRASATLVDAGQTASISRCTGAARAASFASSLRAFFTGPRPPRDAELPAGSRAARAMDSRADSGARIFGLGSVARRRHLDFDPADLGIPAEAHAHASAGANRIDVLSTSRLAADFSAAAVPKPRPARRRTEDKPATDTALRTKPLRGKRSSRCRCASRIRGRH